MTNEKDKRSLPEFKYHGITVYFMSEILNVNNGKSFQKTEVSDTGKKNNSQVLHKYENSFIFNIPTTWKKGLGEYLLINTSLNTRKESIHSLKNYAIKGLLNHFLDVLIVSTKEITLEGVKK